MKKSIVKDQKGFSLIELLIVLGMMAVMVGILAPMYLRFVNNSKVSTDIRNGQELASAFSNAFADSKIGVGTYTEMPDGLNLEDFPPIKWDPERSWTVIMTENGIAYVRINDEEVYPTADQYRTHMQ